MAENAQVPVITPDGIRWQSYSYNELLEALRNDLQLNLATDVIGDGVLPVAGDYKISAVPANQAGWLLCDGASYLRVLFPALFSAVGTMYGSVDATHFNVPTAAGRSFMGSGTGTAAGATAHAVGPGPTTGAGGEEAHAQTAAEMAAHDHGGATGGMSANDPHTHVVQATSQLMAFTGSGGTLNAGAGTNVSGTAGSGVGTANATSIAHTHTIPSQGSGTPFNVMHPVIVGFVLIKT